MTEELNLTGESQREIDFVNNGDNTCKVMIHGPWSASAEIVLDGGSMRQLQNWLASGLTVPASSPDTTESTG